MSILCRYRLHRIPCCHCLASPFLPFIPSFCFCLDTPSPYPRRTHITVSHWPAIHPARCTSVSYIVTHVLSLGHPRRTACGQVMQIASTWAPARQRAPCIRCLDNISMALDSDRGCNSGSSLNSDSKERPHQLAANEYNPHGSTLQR